jgi:glycosyltransferase involved in cell wall biosynthesis
MNIVVINHYAGSLSHGMEFRPYLLAREWQRLGHGVTIIAASESHVRTVTPAVNGSVTEEVVDGIPYWWVKTPPYNGNGIPRTLNMFAFVRWLYVHAGRMASRLRPDVVIASSTYPLDVVPCQRLAQRCGAKLVYEVHDLWPLSPIELGGMSPRHPFIRLMQWAEDFAYAKSDHVVSMLPNALGHMTSRGMQAEKFAYVPNGIDVEEWEGPAAALPDEHAEVIARLKAGGRFTIGYAGAHGLANALDTVLDAAQMLSDSNVTFVLVGQGPDKARLQERAHSLHLDNVEFLPPIPKQAIPSFLAEMDTLFIGLRQTPIFRFGISPNKLMDYMMAAKPVIMAIEAGNDLVAESGCGVSIAPESPACLAKEALELARKSPAERLEMGSRGREYMLAHHDFRVLAQQFLRAIEPSAKAELP